MNLAVFLFTTKRKKLDNILPLLDHVSDGEISSLKNYHAKYLNLEIVFCTKSEILLVTFNLCLRNLCETL